MKNFFDLKALVLSFVLAMICALPVSAQKSDDFFRVDDEFNETRDPLYAWVISNEGIGESPIGSGLLLMVLLGVGYIAINNRRIMKKNITLIVISAMLLCLTQCRKRVDDISENTPSVVHIKLNVGNGSKVNVNPTGGGTFATVSFQNGDRIYVGNNGVYCGYLDYDGETFSGDITPTSTDDYLHFYFVGNKQRVEITEDIEYYVDIQDQALEYPVISYAPSTEKYKAGLYSYSARLKNKCSIVKFTTTDIPMANPVTINGMKNCVIIHFDANNGETTGEPYTFVTLGDGKITLHAESNTERWAILLPQDEVTTTAAASGYITTTPFTIPAISINSWEAAGIPISLSTNGGSLDGEFSVSSTKKVKFSSGNLQAVSIDNWNSCIWSFKAHQYDYDDEANVRENYAKRSVVSHFGYGTSGYDNKLPNMTSDDDNDYVSSDIAGTDYEWGKKNSEVIINRGGEFNWRTLTRDEWVWLTGTSDNVYYNPIPGETCRESSTINEVTNARFVKAYLGNRILGVILFPDLYTHPDGVEYPVGINNSDNEDYWGQNQYSFDDWDKMETAGCVFLPAAGYRDGNDVTDVAYDPTWGEGYYSSSSLDSWNDSYYFKFGDDDCGISTESRYYGHSVRLVRDVE
ncbi:MAG: hypothetical protein J5708_06225 [Bacteroidales bacterium]|nr:hypothetical protein [Bacteroidales bacterium]